MAGLHDGRGGCCSWCLHVCCAGGGSGDGVSGRAACWLAGWVASWLGAGTLAAAQAGGAGGAAGAAAADKTATAAAPLPSGMLYTHACKRVAYIYMQ